MPLTARQIINNCPRQVREGATSAQVSKATPSVTADNRAHITARVKTTLTLVGDPKRRSQTRVYDCTVEAVEPGTRLHKGNIKVSCTCDNFWSNWEVALHKKGAADIIHSNGKKPTVKNPTMLAGCCKHLFRLLDNVLTYKL